MLKLEELLTDFSSINFVFLSQIYRSIGNTSPYLSEVYLMFLESVEHGECE
jgi:hypothetical protein